jgi:hypothetical protein
VSRHTLARFGSLGLARPPPGASRGVEMLTACLLAAASGGIAAAAVGG